MTTSIFLFTFNYEIYFFILFFSFLDNLFSENIVNNIYQINKETKVSFTIPINKFEISDQVTDKTTINELDDLRFVKYENFSGFQHYKYYIKKIKINNINEFPITLSAIHPFTHIKSEFYVTSKKVLMNLSVTQRLPILIPLLQLTHFQQILKTLS